MVQIAKLQGACSFTARGVQKVCKGRAEYEKRRLFSSA